jgi:hypothetical protein
MNPNKRTHQFELESYEQEALGKPFGPEVPFKNGPMLLDRAQDRLYENDQPHTPESANHDRQKVLLDLPKTKEILNKIISDVVDYLPSVSEGAEDFLKSRIPPSRRENYGSRPATARRGRTRSILRWFL